MPTFTWPQNPAVDGSQDKWQCVIDATYLITGKERAVSPQGNRELTVFDGGILSIRRYDDTNRRAITGQVCFGPTLHPTMDHRRVLARWLLDSRRSSVNKLRKDLRRKTGQLVVGD